MTDGKSTVSTFPIHGAAAGVDAEVSLVECGSHYAGAWGIPFSGMID